MSDGLALNTVRYLFNIMDNLPHLAFRSKSVIIIGHESVQAFQRFYHSPMPIL